MKNIVIKLETIKKLSEWINLLSKNGVVSGIEGKEIISQLKHISERSEMKPLIMPKLIKKEEVAEMLNIGLTNFKKLEKEDEFPFKRRMLGSSVRYLNTDVLKYIVS